MNVDLSRLRPAVEMELVTDPRQLAQAWEQDEQFARNLAWLRCHASEVYSQHRGKCTCISSEQLFVADSAREAVALAKAAHPQDQGRFVRYIPRENVPRIDADWRLLASLRRFSADRLGRSAQRKWGLRWPIQKSL